MNYTDIYQINIASELVMCGMLLLLLVTVFTQRRRMAIANILMMLTGSSLLLLLCQIAEWALMLASTGQSGTVPVFHRWKILTYTLDFGLSIFSSFTFYRYADAHIAEEYRQKGVSYSGASKVWGRFLRLWSAGATALFGFLLCQPWFYFLRPDGTEWFHLGSYFTMYLMATLISAATVIKLIRHRQILGWLNFILLLFYKLSPELFVLMDLNNGTCLSYLMRAFYTLILFLNVDVRLRQIQMEREAQMAIQEKELSELRTQIMLSQIQPHFLYNTLTTISSLCYLENAPQSRQVVDHFAAYFRQNMDSLRQDRFVSFEKELEHIRTYLWIEKVRFEEELTVEYRIGPKEFRLPSLSIQPLVENAVKHGICKKKGGGTIIIETRETPEEYQVIVRDDGAGFIPGKLPDDGKSHVGIENITQRLEVLCGGRLEITSLPGEGTTATVHLPKEEAQ